MYIIIEPGYSSNNSIKNTLSGIDIAAKKHKDTVEFIPNLDFLQNSRRPHARAAIVFGASNSWTLRCIETMSGLDIHPIVVNLDHFDIALPHSNVVQDYQQSFYVLSNILINNLASRFAFVGLSKQSSPDRQKYRAFKQALSDHAVAFSEKDLYPIEQDMSECVGQLKENLHKYDSIICANDIIAALVISTIDHPSGYNIAGYGNTRIGQYLSPSLTTVAPNYKKVGLTAGKLFYDILYDDHLLSNIVTVKSELIFRESTTISNIGTPPPLGFRSEVHPVTSYRDQSFKEINLFEKLLSECADIDIRLIGGLKENLSYEQMSAKYYLGVTSVKYRLRKLYKNMSVSSRAEFVSLLNKYKLFEQ